eukprot:Gb_33418 [translate_table: standard]
MRYCFLVYGDGPYSFDSGVAPWAIQGHLNVHDPQDVLTTTLMGSKTPWAFPVLPGLAKERLLLSCTTWLPGLMALSFKFQAPDLRTHSLMDLGRVTRPLLHCPVPLLKLIPSDILPPSTTIRRAPCFCFFKMGHPEEVVSSTFNPPLTLTLIVDLPQLLIFCNSKQCSLIRVEFLSFETSPWETHYIWLLAAHSDLQGLHPNSYQVCMWTCKSFL